MGRYRLPGRKPSGEARQCSLAGAIEQRRGSSAALRSRDEIKGRLVLHHDGYGFVVPDTPVPQFDGDVFIPRDAVEDAMHGDRVVVRFSGPVAGPGPQRAEGRIVRVLGRAHPTVVGLFRYGPRGNTCFPTTLACSTTSRFLLGRS